MSDENKKIIGTDVIVFRSSKNIIMSINNFFLTCTDLLKEIIVNINFINNSNGGHWASGNKEKKYFSQN